MDKEFQKQITPILDDVIGQLMEIYGEPMDGDVTADISALFLEMLDDRNGNV